MSPSLSRYPSPDSDYDEDEVNYRVSPHWPSYRPLFKSRGFRLDTVRDVKHFYIARTGDICSQFVTGDDDALCPDLGLVCSAQKKLDPAPKFSPCSPTISSEELVP